ncbi:MAG: acyl carrier protein [Marinobacter sp.]|nr:acyl carrier protein [Marinobacter sp.]
MATLEQRLVAFIADQLGISADQINAESRIVEDLGADSLDLVELTMAMEEAFNITIEDDQADQLTTVADMIRFLETQPA